MSGIIILTLKYKTKLNFKIFLFRTNSQLILIDIYLYLHYCMYVCTQYQLPRHFIINLVCIYPEENGVGIDIIQTISKITKKNNITTEITKKQK